MLSSFLARFLFLGLNSVYCQQDCDWGHCMHVRFKLNTYLFNMDLFMIGWLFFSPLSSSILFFCSLECALELGVATEAAFRCACWCCFVVVVVNVKQRWLELKGVTRQASESKSTFKPFGHFVHIGLWDKHSTLFRASCQYPQQTNNQIL